MSRQLMDLCKKELLIIYKHALEAVKPENLVRKSVRIEHNELSVRDPLDSKGEPVKFDLSNRNLHVIGGGKCVLGMAKGLAELCKQANLNDHLFSHGCLSLPVGLKESYENDTTTKDNLNSLNIECLFGSENNLPDENSVSASDKILTQVEEACRRDKLEMRRPLFVVLISGGGSACLTAPRLLDLESKVRLIKCLTQKGADIVELNKVRMYFSNLKGGNLARQILNNHPQAQILTLILSDVIGDPIEYIASGPTYLDKSPSDKNSYESMMEVIIKYGLSHLVPKLDNFDVFGEIGSDISVRKNCITNRIIGNNKIALDATVEMAESLGYKIEYMGNNMQGPTRDIVNQIIRFAADKIEHNSIGQQKYLVVSGGEATVEKNPGENWGKGGRAQEMALDYMIYKLCNKDLSNPSDIDLFLAAGTDGQDGPTDVAGCIASLCEIGIDGGRELRLEDIEQAKKLHDSYNFWLDHKPDWLIKTGLTGTNVMDLYLYLRVNTST